jgi:hypothetical protein
MRSSIPPLGNATAFTARQPAGNRGPVCLPPHPVAALSLADGSVIADPFRRTARLIPLLHMRARALKAHSRTPSLRERLRAGVRPAAVAG